MLHKNHFSSLAGRLTAAALLALVLTAHPAASQDTGGDVAIGGQIGSPSGLTLKFQNPDLSYELLAAWDLDSFFLVNLNGLWQRRLQAGESFYLFYGPGAYLGIRDRAADNSDIVVGINVTGGLSYYFERFEAYIRLTPRLNLVPSTTADIGGGIGLRYYL